LRRLAHQAQSFLDFPVGDNIQEGRLTQLYRKGLLQGVVKNGIVGLVDEVRQQHTVFFGERRGLDGSRQARAQIDPAHDHG
jgi:hypothetical protein